MVETVQRRMKRALLLYRQSRYDLALNEALGALAEDCNDCPAHTLAAWCHLSLGRPHAGERAARESIRCGPGEWIGWHALSEALQMQQRTREALEAIRHAIELEPESATVHRQHAHVLHARGERTEALAALHRALEFDPNEADTHALRAKILEELQQDDAASASTGIVLNLEAENADGHALHGWLALRTGDLATAERSFLESLRLNPGGNHARDGIVAIKKMRHPLLRWTKPGWRGMRDLGPDEAKEQARTQGAKWVGRLWTVMFFPSQFTLKYFFAHWGMPGWAAWCAATLAGLVVGLALAVVLLCAGIFASLVAREGSGLVAQGLHAVLVGPLGDLVLAMTRDGRRFLPAWRIRLGALVLGVILLVAGAAFALSNGHSLGILRTAIALMLLGSSIFVCCFGFERRWQFGPLPAVLLAAYGIHCGSWSLGGAGLLLTLTALMWCTSEDARVARWLAVNYLLGALCCFALGLSTWITNAPGFGWSLFAAAISVGSGFLVPAVCSPQSPEATPTQRAE